MFTKPFQTLPHSLFFLGGSSSELLPVWLLLLEEVESNSNSAGYIISQHPCIPPEYPAPSSKGHEVFFCSSQVIFFPTGSSFGTRGQAAPVQSSHTHTHTWRKEFYST